ncbi:MAG: 3-dehydroquinate synthase [Flavobacteriaceae bacterium]|nr:3-dehydroquinate synthase [Flavobacteriaceae bacterium]MCI5087556.1 3-dehydroquinate synthase [Flavobacteriaceae bacterium]CAI8197974.1 MAG: 3-dehydroquinate synthase [SAR116 cluster bacterium]
MTSINTPNSKVFFSAEAHEALNKHLVKKDYSKVFILVDENTHKHCLGAFMGSISGDYSFEIIEIDSGEINKTVETCTQIWEVLSELGADRKSVLINLGGGVITDMGGFIAATFKRGIDFINVPTTLLSMVDASVGGKTGVDLGALKNQVGVITEPVMVLVIPSFLKTLEERQVRSGFAEMLKHGLIKDSPYWKKLSKISDYQSLEAHISKSIRIKTQVVIEDPYEQGLRKILNFGHTLGHAIESHFLNQGSQSHLLHGEAIAIGMILEAYISNKLLGLSEKALEEISSTFTKHFGKINISKEEVTACLSYLKFDKKNSHGDIKFVGLSDIGVPVIDILVPEELILESFTYYASL